jgi:hypothetical protein
MGGSSRLNFNIPTLADFSCYHWKAESVTIAVFLSHLKFRRPPYQEEQLIQPVRNKEKVKTDSDWSETDGKILRERKLEAQ